MKCICPSGGKRTCPDDCLIAVWHKLPDDQKTKERRRPMVEQLAKQGYTQDAIAGQIGVTQMTICRDLKSLNIAFKLPPSTSKRGRKGEGRQRGSGKGKGSGKRGEAAKFKKACAIIRPLIEQDKPLKLAELEKEHNISRDTFERAAIAVQESIKTLAELEIDPTTLAMTAQQKLEVAKRQQERKLNMEHAERMRHLDEEVRQRVLKEGKEYLDMLQEKRIKAEKTEALYHELVNHNKPAFTADQFKTILMCLHPDGVRSAGKLNEAFRLFNAKKVQLTGEK